MTLSKMNRNGMSIIIIIINIYDALHEQHEQVAFNLKLSALLFSW
jgi:hypothetical protein